MSAGADKSSMTNIQSQLQNLASLITQQASKTNASTTSLPTANVQVAQFNANGLLLAQGNRQVKLPIEQLQGKLVEGKSYQANVSLQKLEQANVQSILNLFEPKAANPLPLPAPLTQKLLQQPLQQLLAATQGNQQKIQLTATVTQVNQHQVLLKVAGETLTLPLKNASQLLQPGQQVQLLLQPKTNQWQVQLLPVANKPAINIETSPQQQTVLTKGALQQGEIKQLDKQLVTQLVQHTPELKGSADKLNQFIQQTPGKSLPLITDKQGKLAIAPLPVATVKTSAEQTQALQNMKLPVISASQLAPSADVETQAATAPSPATKLSPAQQAIQQLFRQIRPQTESPSVLLQRIETALSDPQFQGDDNLKNLLAQVKQQIQMALPSGREQDHQQLKQLMAAPTLNLTPVQIVSPPANQGFMAGLLTMLQMSLTARLARQQPAQMEKLVSAINGLLGKSKPSQTTKGISDFQQLDQKHQLLKEIGRALAGHQSSKLSSAEQQLQGQESFYYTLPLGIGNDKRDAELLIRREPEKQNSGKNKAIKGSHWKLSMKLDLGDLGQLLAKASLKDKDLELDFYASNQQTLEQVLNFVPLLRRRFKKLGIEVLHNRCQLGKIPDSLQQTPYQIFEARV